MMNTQIRKIASKSTPIRLMLRFLMHIIYKMRYEIRRIGVPIEQKTVLFCVFGGYSYSDSPRRLYETMLSDDRYVDYKFIWAFKDLKSHIFLKDNRNTELVQFGSLAYERALAASKYWIFNARVSGHIYPRKNGKQIYVQCWHGTPLKKLGHDIEVFGSIMNSRREIEWGYKIDAEKLSYFVSPSEYCSEKFASAWDLKGVSKESAMLTIGYPRNDLLTASVCASTKEKRAVGLPVTASEKKIILYAPTYRDDQYSLSTGYTYDIHIDFDDLNRKLSDEYVILFRAHYLITNGFDFDKYKGFVYDYSAYDDIGELYLAADLLITDYSSVFFDFANLRRPMIMYMYDRESYVEDTRGFYINPEEIFPGPVVFNGADLADAIKELSETFVYDDKYKALNERFNYLDDGSAAARLAEIVFNNLQANP